MPNSRIICDVHTIPPQFLQLLLKNIQCQIMYSSLLLAKLAVHVEFGQWPSDLIERSLAQPRVTVIKLCIQTHE